MIRQPSALCAWIGTRRSGSRASVGTVSSVTRIRRSFRSASDHRFSFSSRRTSTSPAIDLRGASVSLTRTAKLLCSSPPPLPRRAKDTERTRNEQPYSNQRLFERKFRAIYLAANHLVDRSSATPVRASSTLKPCIRGTPEVRPAPIASAGLRCADLSKLLNPNCQSEASATRQGNARELESCL